MRHLHGSVGATDGEPAADTALDPELSAQLFGSLRRSGQRLKAEQYVRGLLALEGRKTLRGIAAQFDGAAAQQSVHHFISASPWDWMPVRHALAREVQRALAPQAWVIRPILIPKAGSHSVGIDQQLLPLGRIVNGQHAVGAWLASGHCAVPVDWQLRLSDRWLTDPLRQRASVPADAAVATIEDCVRAAVADIREIGGVLRGPVVVDVGEVDAVAVARHLAALGVAFVVRVGPQAQLWLDRTELPSYSGREHTVGELAESLPRLRRQVNPGDGPTTAVAIPVVTSPARGERMLLLGEWRPAGRPRRRLWLTNADAPSVLTALRLTRLPGVVLRDFTAISERVGVRDFGGRSFPGWHRHITLASVAHLIATLENRRPLLPGGRAGR
ncbi:transposase [Kitasatospora sp. NPDC001603]|uniref:IS701 family transposase n=1 Tax=Kitasatospora sp. NPDC001603 TaxID=3154388 RepID=UPI003333FDD8